MPRKRLLECEGTENKDLWPNESCFYFFEVGGSQLLRKKVILTWKNFKNTGTCSYTSILDACLVLNIENFSLIREYRGNDFL